MGSLLGDDVAARVAAYEVQFQDRTIKIYGNAAISAASVTFDGYTAGSDPDAKYTLTWTSSSTQILVEFAGHLAVGESGGAISYGTGKGSASISGGPYHIPLDLLDGASLGNKDNQIKGADIIIPCPTCSVVGNDNICPGSSNTYTETISGTCLSAAITWSISGDGTISGSNTGSSVTVIAAKKCGAYTITANVSCSNCASGVSCSKTVQVVDTTPPVLAGCPSNASFQCYADVPGAATVTATDNCAGTLTPTFSETQTHQGGSCNNVITRTWTATDACGNGATCTQTINVNDTTAPVLSGCPTDVNVQCIGDVPGAATVTATDNCAGALTPVLTETQSNRGSSCNNVITRTWTATDACGNQATCTQHINVNDTTRPVLSGCPTSDVSVQCLTDAPAAATVTATDNCAGALTPVLTETQSNPGSSCNNVITRTWTATDACGNQASCAQRINVNDTTPPVLSGCPTADVSVQCLTDLPTAATVTATDNCSGTLTPAFTQTQSKPGSNCGNVVTRTWTATDACGNKASCAQRINVNDTTAPTITCPGNINAACNAATTFDASATDNCGGTVTTTCSPPSGTVFPAGVTTVTCTATDACGNAATCTFTVTGQSCSGKIAPTATTCSDFTGNTAEDLTQVCYGVKSGKVSNTAPGVFFYYSKVTSNVDGTFTVKVEQTKCEGSVPCTGSSTPTNFPYLAVAGANQATLYTPSCSKYTTIVGTDNPSTGVVTYSIPNATNGQQFVISVKYSTSLGNATNAGSKPTVHYDFRTTVGGLTFDQDPDGLNFVYRQDCATVVVMASRAPQLDMQGSIGDAGGIELYRPTPNPFDHSMQMAYAVSGAGEQVSIRVFDLAGRLIRTLVDEPKSPGRYLTTWDGRGEDGSRQMNAMYFVHIMIGDRVRSVRVAYMH